MGLPRVLHAALIAEGKQIMKKAAALALLAALVAVNVSAAEAAGWRARGYGVLSCPALAWPDCLLGLQEPALCAAACRAGALLFRVLSDQPREHAYVLTRLSRCCPGCPNGSRPPSSRPSEALLRDRTNAYGASIRFALPAQASLRREAEAQSGALGCQSVGIRDTAICGISARCETRQTLMAPFWEPIRKLQCP